MRKHSKFSASGADRWFKCPGSVELSEGMPDKSSPWAIEGTQAHAVLEVVLGNLIAGARPSDGLSQLDFKPTKEMVDYGERAALFIHGQWKAMFADIMVETRIESPIHQEAFGTFDAAIVEHFDILHVFDYKYGAGHAVFPSENLQMIFYAIALASKYDWNFKLARLWIIQPRVKGYDGPMFWDVSMSELKYYWLPLFEAAVVEVINNPKWYAEGSHCHWCKAKSICPLKNESKLEEAKTIFSKPEVSNGESEKEKSGQKEKQWRKAFSEGKVQIREKAGQVIEEDFF